MKDIPVNRYEVAALRHLRHSETARFSDLMRATALQSDSFKFYLRKLQKEGYVEKADDGAYRLTPSGKEYANRIDDKKAVIQKQPKLSMIMIAERTNEQGDKEYLMHHRARHPYWGYWGFFSDRVRWGERFEDTAAVEFLKQTGYQATMTVSGFYHKHDFLAKDKLVEDILFVIMEATDLQGELRNGWKGGHSQWMTLNELRRQEKLFPDTEATLEIMHSKKSYTASTLIYDESMY